MKPDYSRLGLSEMEHIPLEDSVKHAWTMADTWLVLLVLGLLIAGTIINTLL